MTLEEDITKYLDGAAGSHGRAGYARYTAFNCCFNYSQSFRKAGNERAIAEAKNIQLSCLHLGFYLAS